jgi:hypothetical protein
VEGNRPAEGGASDRAGADCLKGRCLNGPLSAALQARIASPRGRTAQQQPINRRTVPSRARLEYRLRRVHHLVAEGGDEALIALVTIIADRFNLNDPIDRLLEGGR